MRRILALALAVPAAAQEARFDVQSRLVLVPATVTDRQGRPVDGLGAADFVVLDNGRPQAAAVDTIATGVAPIALVVAVQSSGISAAALAKVRKIGAMIHPLITGERGCAALVAFDEEIEWLQECTSDPDALPAAFGRLRPGEPKAARMLDAAYDAVERLRSRGNVRRVLLLISESRDRGSETDLDTMIVAAQAAGVTVYAATYSAFATAFTVKPSDTRPASQPRGPARPPRGPEMPPSKANIPVPPPEQRVDILGGIGELARLRMPKATEALARATGGATFSFTRKKGLEEAIGRLGSELHTQYVLSFTPEAPAPGYHRVEVRVVRGGSHRVRARPGYWAPQ
jgi:VWFA-related protein